MRPNPEGPIHQKPLPPKLRMIAGMLGLTFVLATPALAETVTLPITPEPAATTTEQQSSPVKKLKRGSGCSFGEHAAVTS